MNIFTRMNEFGPIPVFTPARYHELGSWNFKRPARVRHLVKPPLSIGKKNEVGVVE